MTDIAPTDDTFESDFDNAREAEQDHVSQEAPKQQEPQEPQQQVQKPGLSVEELDKRYRSTKTALNQEREERRKLAQQIEDLRQQSAKPSQQETTDQGPPDPTVDPIGAIQWQNEQILNQQRTQAEQQKAQAEANRQQEGINRVASWGREQENDFRADNPDYDQAATHFAKARIQELADEGHPQAQLERVLMNELLGLTQRAQAQGANPAEWLYKLAQNRGYKRGAPTNQAKETLERVANGQQQNRSLSSSGGRPAGGGNLSMGQVADLKGAAFDKAFDQLRAANKAKRA